MTDAAVIVQILRPIFFVAFFLGTAIAYHYQDRFHLRRLHLSMFFTCLILTSLIGTQLLPVVTLHKFVLEGPEERTEHEIRLVDERGAELELDARAIDPVPASRITTLGEQIAIDYDDRERRDVASYILQQARAYRNSVEDDSWVRHDQVAFPRHGKAYRWTTDLLEEYGSFAGVRVYEVRSKYTEDGREVIDQQETLVYEYTAPDNEESV